jgi:hypothetical protein
MSLPATSADDLRHWDHAIVHSGWRWLMGREIVRRWKIGSDAGRRSFPCAIFA